MCSKIIVIACTLAVVSARPQHEHDSHGHAYSSQSIVLHQSHPQELREPAHQEQQQLVYLHQPVHSVHAPQQQEQQYHQEDHHVDYYAIPKYTYEYKVEDPHTHDSKYQRETRDHDVVKGEYSLHQPDGRIRIVKYTADKKNGFQAEVKYEGHAQHIVPEQHGHH
ncbi:sex-determining region Y protein-like [Plodia interpunctella]|uniref:sex-determining region Y protein-like n=1 Tax=Plodia interpunctella TaxID=58824 RepID=UPI002367EC91|nr:sex-determining region Y protein-like [Plodia interpunctella]